MSKQIKWQVEENEDGGWAVYCGKSAINIESFNDDGTNKEMATYIKQLLNSVEATPDYFE
jgi:hypothetical protein